MVKKMGYTREQIYLLVGKLDKVTTLEFYKNSEAYQIFGNSLTVVFMYEQAEREELDKIIQSNQTFSHGRIKARELLFELSSEKKELLLKMGINSEDIADLYFSKSFSRPNTFHSSDKRNLNKEIIEISSLPKGGDYGWMYGFQKKLVKDGIINSPHERCFYLGCKMYFQPNDISEQEKLEIFDDSGLLREPIEMVYLEIKFKKEEIGIKEQQKFQTLKENKRKKRLAILDSYLDQAGSSFKKLSEKNQHQANELLSKVQLFNERRLNIIGKHPIYMDIDSYLHIYMRHVEEFKVNQHFEHKANFQWNENDVFMVMESIIQEIDNDYQKFREVNPNSRFSKYGKQSIYFQGDYYTFHIDESGRISTFYKNRKAHEESIK